MANINSSKRIVVRRSPRGQWAGWDIMLDGQLFEGGFSMRDRAYVAAEQLQKDLDHQEGNIRPEGNQP